MLADTVSFFSPPVSSLSLMILIRRLFPICVFDIFYDTEAKHSQKATLYKVIDGWCHTIINSFSLVCDKLFRISTFVL